MATCIATNVIFLQATHFVDIDSRDHFFSISLGAPNCLLVLRCFTGKASAPRKAISLVNCLEHSWRISIETQAEAEAGSRKPMDTLPRSFFSASLGPPEKTVGSWKEDDRSGFLLFFWVTFQGRSAVKLREDNSFFFALSCAVGDERQG